MRGTKVSALLKAQERLSKLEERLARQTRREREAVEKAKARLEAKLDSPRVEKTRHRIYDLKANIKLRQAALTGTETGQVRLQRARSAS